MLSCEIIPYTMLLRIEFQNNPTWRRPPRLLVGSATSLRIAAKNRTKNRHAISQRMGEKNKMALLAEASSLHSVSFLSRSVVLCLHCHQSCRQYFNIYFGPGISDHVWKLCLHCRRLGYAQNKPLHSFHGRYIYTYRLIPCLLRPVPLGQQVGLFVFFSACSDYHGQLRSRSDGRILNI